MTPSILSRLAAGLFGEPPGQKGPGSGGTWQLPEGVERLEAVRWAYRTILLREPESREALEHLAASAPSPKALRDQLMRSAEAHAQPEFPVIFSMSGNEPRQTIQVDVTPEQQKALFERVQAVWHALGESKPHWSVITTEEYQPENIGRTMDAFYSSGESNVATLLRTLERNGIDASRLRTCMDFGCGVGRLSAALARKFEAVVAVDVSASHLAIAKEALAQRNLENVTTHRLETVEGLARLPQCDLIYSLIVLQHNPPPVMRALFAGLLGRLAPGGVAVIQLPTYMPGGYRFDAEEYLVSGGRDMEMHALPQAVAFATARAAGVELLEVLEDGWTGFGSGSRSNTFVLRRPA